MEKNMIIETHAHYDDETFDADRAELLGSMRENGIETIVNVGASLASVKKTIELTREYPFVYGAVGIHPSDIAGLNEETFAWLSEQAKLDKIVAIGEIGLDYYWDTTQKDNQKYWFKKQLELAAMMKLPVIIHSRDAAQDTFELLKESVEEAKSKGLLLTGVIHCFAYSVEMAYAFLNLGFYLGIGGVATFKNAKNIKEVIQRTPIERLVIETDSPYLTPEPNRGKRNSSLHLPQIAKAIAELKNTDYETVIGITTQNAKNLYGLL